MRVGQNYCPFFFSYIRLNVQEAYQNDRKFQDSKYGHRRNFLEVFLGKDAVFNEDDLIKNRCPLSV